MSTSIGSEQLTAQRDIPVMPPFECTRRLQARLCGGLARDYFV